MFKVARNQGSTVTMFMSVWHGISALNMSLSGHNKYYFVIYAHPQSPAEGLTGNLSLRLCMRVSSSQKSVHNTPALGDRRQGWRLKSVGLLLWDVFLEIISTRSFPSRLCLLATDHSYYCRFLFEVSCEWKHLINVFMTIGPLFVIGPYVSILDLAYILCYDSTGDNIFFELITAKLSKGYQELFTNTFPMPSIYVRGKVRFLSI